MQPHECVLIVDDEPNVRLMMRTALESSGYRVVEAADGQAALSQLFSEPCDLILLDLRMPRVDGMATLEKLRERGSSTPVVMLTAHGSIPDAVAAMKLGAIDFLTKPITPSELRTVVAEVIRRHHEPPAPAPLAPARSAEPARAYIISLERAKRALNHGRFAEAERMLRDVLKTNPDAADAHELLDRLLVLKEREGAGSYRVLRQWFPGG